MEGLQQSAPCASDVLNGQVWGSWCVLKTVLALVGGMWWDLCHGPSGPLVVQTAGFALEFLLTCKLSLYWW